ncbi:hypothetical protein [Aquabacterium sp. CECT 9606]|uniref:pilus assembly PilX family protein n=1 Tax=Aquabacterium sp. CECT 9606 TaxID=2845822 RepID=UPI001E422046|nr:hypothetical protein [Aquabacterium sp. CECT 9606]
MVLIVVLIMLVVIGLVSAAAMRGALTADQISNNARLENLAKQAAQIALRFCEAQLVPTPRITIYPAPTDIGTDTKATWETYAHWSGPQAGIKATTVPESYLKATDSYAPRTLPQCLVENSRFSPNAKIVTARGFGPDYDATRASGSVVWLQSVVSLQPAATPTTPATPSP